MPRDKSDRRGAKSEGRAPRRRGMGRRKVCRFCADKAMLIDYKDARGLGNFLSERGKIIPGRITGTCARHQRMLMRVRDFTLENSDSPATGLRLYPSTER